MTNNQYLELVLSSQKLSDSEKVTLSDNRDEIEALLRDEFADTPLIKFAGSKAKGTMIKASYDLDIVCYFPYEYDATLKEIYIDVCDKISGKYYVDKKASALRINLLDKDGQPIVDSHIDVVPGKFSDEENQDAYLYRHGSEKERLKTNIKKHLGHVVNSGCRKEIKLLKYWSILNSLAVKTFVLELLVIKILKNSDKTGLSDRMLYLLQVIRDNIDSITIEDPANPDGNDLYELFNETTKRALQIAAGLSIQNITSSGWESVFGKVQLVQDTIAEYSKNVLLEDFSHREKLSDKGIKLQLKSEFWVSLDAGLYFGLATYPIKNRLFKSIFEKNSFLPKYHWLLYTIKTNVPFPHKIFLQVVNTGEEAERAQLEGRNGLRGQIFEWSNERWERSEYIGKHWIEAFIVVNGQCVARSGPFFVVF